MELRRVPHDHPYFRYFVVRANEHRVKWRDFYGIRQDIDCSSLEHGRQIALNLLSGPVFYNSDEAGGQTYRELTEYWASIRGTQ